MPLAKTDCEDPSCAIHAAHPELGKHLRRPLLEAQGRLQSALGLLRVATG